MATKNVIDSNNPVEVGLGGTGTNTLTDHGVLVGSGASAITPLSVGATGTLLVGSTGADPAFAASATGDFTFTGAVSASNRELKVENTYNSNTASGSVLRLQVGGSSAGDPKLVYTIPSGATWSHGTDNSDSDAFKIAASSALGTTTVMRISPAGEITEPLQPAFLASLSSQQANVTGNDTKYSYVCNTEIFDQNGDYNNSTGVFTAPVTGRYVFTAETYLTGCTTAISGDAWIVTSNRSYYTGRNRAASSADMLCQISVLVDMDASDTAYPQVRAYGNGADTCDLEGVSGSDTRSAFSGYLAC